MDASPVALLENARPRRTADPFIAELIAKLQAEVREERRLAMSLGRTLAGGGRFAGLPAAERSEAEITWSGSPLHFTVTDFESWERRSLPPRER
jgi:hypothetical protein